MLRVACKCNLNRRYEPKLEKENFCCKCVMKKKKKEKKNIIAKK